MQKIGICFLGFVLMLTFSVGAQTPLNEVDREFKFADELIKRGLSDYAKLAIDQLVEKNPDLKEQAETIDVLILVAQNKIDEADKLLATMNEKDPKVQGVNLRIANRFYVRGKVEVARKRYDSFFAGFGTMVPTDAGLLKEYVEATWLVARMLKEADDFAGAIKALERVVSAEPPAKIERNVLRRLQVDLGWLFVDFARTQKDETAREASLTRAEKLANDVTFGGLDILFSEAVNILVTCKIIRGDEDGALVQIDEYKAQMAQIDKMLEAQGNKSASPMAGLRFLRGEIFERRSRAAFTAGDKEKGTKLMIAGATDYANVYAKYPGSDWSFKSKLIYDKCNNYLEEMISKRMPELTGLSSEALLATANKLYKRKRYAEAAPAFLVLLNSYPEVKISAEAGRKLAISYLESGDVMLAKVTADYMGERLGSRIDSVANDLLIIAAKFNEKGKPEAQMWLLERFAIAYFPENQKSAQVLYLMAGSAKNSGDVAEMRRLYELLLERFPNSIYSLAAVAVQANVYFTNEAWEKAKPLYEQYINLASDVQKGYGLADARYRLAYIQAKMGDVRGALVSFNALKKDLVKSADNPYYGGDNPQLVPNLVERVHFQLASTLAAVPDETPNAAQFHTMGLRYYDQFLADFPEADLAPQSMFEKGRLQLKAGDAAAGAKTFEELSERFPESPQGKSALLSLVIACIETGNEAEAKKAVQKMLTQPKSYSVTDFVLVGEAMLKFGLYEEGERCMQYVMDSPTTQEKYKRRVMTGLIESRFNNKKYEATITDVDAFLDEWPKAAELWKVKFMKVDALIELKRFPEANFILTDVVKKARGAGLTAIAMEADMKVARIRIAMGEPEEALSSYTRITWGDSGKEDLAPFIAEAYRKGMKIAEELGRKKDLLAMARDYIESFPDAKDVDEMKKLRNKLELETL